MRKLLVCQHVPHEILGTLNPLLKRAGFRIRYVNFGRHPDAQPDLDGYAGLIVLGGPMSAYDDQRLPHLAVEMKLIEAALQRNLPVLGICLGAQLIARTLGARVYANHIKEIGWYDVSPTDAAESDPLLAPELRRRDERAPVGRERRPHRRPLVRSITRSVGSVTKTPVASARIVSPTQSTPVVRT